MERTFVPTDTWLLVSLLVGFLNACSFNITSCTKELTCGSELIKIILIYIEVELSVTMRSKEVTIQVKKVILRLKKISKNLSSDISVSWFSKINCW